MIINNLNNAEILLIKSDKICEFLIDKRDYKIIQTKNITEETNIDITDQCINVGCKYIIDPQGDITIDYKVGVLAKILNSEVDMSCIEFLGNLNFDVVFY